MIEAIGAALRRLVSLCARHPHAVILGAAALGLAALIPTVAGLRFEASELHLLPAGQPFVTRYQQYSAAFGELDEVVIVIRGTDREQARAFADRLVGVLRAGPVAFNHLAHRVALSDLGGRALLYLPRARLQELQDAVYDHQEFIEKFAAAPGLVALLGGLHRELASSFAAQFLDLGVESQTSGADGLAILERITGQLRDTVGGRPVDGSPWRGVFGRGELFDDSAGYFGSADGTLLYIVADPAAGPDGFTSDAAAIDRIRAEIAKLRPEFPGVQAGVTGGPALATDGMRSALGDSGRSTLLAFALTLGVLVAAFRRLFEPLLMLAILALSVLWSLGLITLVVGHLTVFSVMFISIVVGLGIDYGIYVLFRYDAHRLLGSTAREALETMASRSGPGIALGALAGATTFYVLARTDFHGVREFGFIAGTALLLALVAMLTVLPAALTVTSGRVHRRTSPGARSAEQSTPFLDWCTRRPGLVLGAAALLTGLAVSASRGLQFDYDLLNLQARSTESVVWERAIIATHGSSYTALATAASFPELVRKQRAFERLSSVAKVESALAFIPGEQRDKRRLLSHIRRVVSPVRIGTAPALDVDEMTRAVTRLQRLVALAVEEAGEVAPAPLRAASTNLADVRRTLQGGDRAQATASLSQYQARLVRDFSQAWAVLQRNLDPRPVTSDDLPKDVRRKFISEQEGFLLHIHPKGNIWNRGEAIRFVEELRSVDPEVTGTPVVSYESIRRMEAAYREGALWGFLVVGLLAAVALRRLRHTLLALTPLVLGALWAVGLMAAMGFSLNFANVWGVPLIIGASAEYGVNIVVRAMEARAHGGPRFARSTVMAVAFNGLTTITGFGTLMLAHHRGMWSLGLLLTIGSVTSLVASLVVLPVVIALFER